MHGGHAGGRSTNSRNGARAFEAAGGYAAPESQSPWQQYFREKVGRFDQGMILEDADKYQDIARKHMPRDNH